MFAIAILVLIPLAGEGKPAPRLPLGKETTYVTGPLDKQGYINYEAALNDLLSQGITPDKNANALIWMALGPHPEGLSMPLEFFKALGIREPPERGDYFVDLKSFLKNYLKLDEAEWEDVYDQLTRTTQRPWDTRECPHITTWLKLNEKPLALVIEATKRPNYYNPFMSRRTEVGPGPLIGALLPGVQKCRELAAALAARAMMRASEKKFDEAWGDLLACHRLGRFISRGASIIEALVGIALNQIASTADLAYLERASLTSKQIQDHLKDLQDLPPLAPLADKVDLGERFIFLDSLQLIRRGSIGRLEAVVDGRSPRKPDPEEVKAFEKINWEPAFRNGNRWYDRLAETIRLKDRATREKKLNEIEEKFEALKQEGVQANLLVNEGRETPDKAIGKAISNSLVGLMLPSIRKIQIAYDRLEQIQRNLHVAFA
jgi:hypothetical protein